MFQRVRDEHESNEINRCVVFSVLVEQNGMLIVITTNVDRLPNAVSRIADRAVRLRSDQPSSSAAVRTFPGIAKDPRATSMDRVSLSHSPHERVVYLWRFDVSSREVLEEDGIPDETRSFA